MKLKYIVILFLLTINVVGYSQTKFEDIGFEQALAKAAKKGSKLVFLDCYTSWCMPCRYMTASVFTQPKVGEFFNANFVNIKMDMEKGNGPELMKRYGVKVFPTFLILKADGTEIGRVVGSSEADEFIKKVKFIMQPENSIENIKNKYIANKNLETGKQYINLLNDSGAEYSDIVRELYDIVPFQDKFDREFIDLIFSAIDSPFDPLLDKVVINKWKLNQVIGRSGADEKLRGIYSSYLLRVLWKTKGVKPSVEGIIEAAKGVARFDFDPTRMDAHLGQIALLCYNKEIDVLLEYIENNLTVVAANEQKSTLEHIGKLVKEGSKEQKERFNAYIRGVIEVLDFSKDGLEKSLENNSK